MDSRDKVLYVQIHPVKQLTDWGGAAAGLILLWYHALVEGIVVAVLPSLLSAAIIIRYVNLDRYRDSAFGQYFGKHMGRPVAWARIAGLISMGYGAWQHWPFLIVIGSAIVLLFWGSGLFYLLGPGRSNRVQR